MVSLKAPCSACIIITNLLKEMLGQVARKNPQVQVQVVLLQDVRQLEEVPGAQGKRFPILLFNGKQMSAGLLPREDELERLIAGT